MKWKNEYLYALIFALCFVGFQYLEEVIRIDYNNQNKFYPNKNVSKRRLYYLVEFYLLFIRTEGVESFLSQNSKL